MSEWEIVETPAGPARLRRTARRTLGISVLPDGSLELVAPARATLEDIVGKVVKRKSWIARQRRDFAALNDRRTARRYVTGATHRYLGRQYRLKVRRGSEAGVKLSGGYFVVTTDSATEGEVEQLLSAWMRARATEQFRRRVARWETWCARQKLPIPKMVLRSMPKRWGSAQKSGRIALNPELVRAPSVCIDYVIAHEICHLKYPDHGRRFWGLLGQFVPNWAVVKSRLEMGEG